METKQITKSDEELYCEVHRNLEMSAESTTAVLKKVENKKLLTHLTEVIMKSTALLEKTEEQLERIGLHHLRLQDMYSAEMIVKAPVRLLVQVITRTLKLH